MDAITEAPKTKLREQGIYFGLDEDSYHADPALGSSSIRKLAKNPADYWWGSHMNPMRPPDKDTKATERGTAVHVMVLHGEAEFDRRYIRGASNDASMSPAEKSAATKAANAKAAAVGKIALPGQTYDSIAIAAAMISKNPLLATALVGGATEVSVFWTDAESKLRKKARYDMLKPRGIGDLKSITNRFEKPFPQACIDQICNYAYHVQAKHYLDARAQVPRLISEGRVFGRCDPDFLKSLAAAKQWGWQWVFWQAEGAPLTFTRKLSPQNPILEMAAATISTAEQNYIAYMDRFGPDSMWMLIEDHVQELYNTDMPPWFGRY